MVYCEVSIGVLWSLYCQDAIDIVEIPFLVFFK